MTTHKTAELTGALLDLAVAQIEGQHARVERFTMTMYNEDGTFDRLLVDEDRCLRIYKSYDGEEKGGFWLHYSGKWEQGGPIIERERITVQASRAGDWRAFVGDGDTIQARGDTPLIAAMRAYVTSKLGDTVELPA